MLFDRPYTRGRTTMVPLIWLLGQPHLRWEWWPIIPSSPVVTIVFYHVMEVSCYHSFWAVTSRLCLRLLLWGLLLISTSRHSVEVCSMSNLSALTSKSASRSYLRIHLGCLTALLEQSIWSPRLPQEMQRRSSRWAHTSFGIPLAPTIWLSGEPAVSIVSSCGSTSPKKGWRYRLWMCLDPISWYYSLRD
jgi:hypothetical protein